MVGGAGYEENSPKRRRGDNIISFFNDDLVGVQTAHDDAIFVSMIIANYDIKHVLVDNGSFINMLFYDAFS